MIVTKEIARRDLRAAARKFASVEADAPGRPDVDRALEIAAVEFVAAFIRARVSDDNPDLARGGSVASHLEALAVAMTDRR